MISKKIKRPKNKRAKNSIMITAEEIEQVKKLSALYTIKQIALMIGVSYDAVLHTQNNPANKITMVKREGKTPDKRRIKELPPAKGYFDWGKFKNF